MQGRDSKVDTVNFNVRKVENTNFNKQIMFELCVEVND